MKLLSLLSTAVALAVLGLAATASSAAAAPELKLRTLANSSAAPGGTVEYFVTATNVGDQATSTGPDLHLTLPAGLVAESFVDPEGLWECPTLTPGAQTVDCSFLRPLEPLSQPFAFHTARLRLIAAVDPLAEGVLTAGFEVGGGEAGPVTTVDPTLITTDPPQFGIDSFDGQITANAAGDPHTQAAGHPYSISTTILFNTLTNPNPLLGGTWPVEPAKNILVDLPPGFAGFPGATGGVRCTQVDLSHTEATEAQPRCAPGSQVGVTEIITSNGSILGPLPVFNVVPPPDVPARFGFNVAGSVVVLDAELRSGGDYGLSVNVREVPQGLALAGTSITFWGAPADPSHLAERSCPDENPPGIGGPSCPTELPRRAFLRNATSCLGPQDTALRADSWVDPGDFREASFTGHNPPAYPSPPSDWGAPQGTTGCEDVPFEPSITVRATSPYADSPTGLDVDLAMPQSDDPDAIGQADVKDSRVSLPEGMVVNPAAAAGLVGCSEADVGLDSAGNPQCPDASRIGTVTIESPQLDDDLRGPIYQAAQFDNPGDHLLGFYTVAKGSGVIVKLAAHVERDPQTGRLTTVFEDSPQLPFDHYKLHFNDGPRAALINPPTCGTKTTDAVFTSWARPDEEVALTDSFQVTSGPNGAPCPNGLAGRPFDPKLTAGVVDPTAGATSPFVLKLTREDGEQRFRGLTVGTPEGLSAYLKGVPYCPEAALASISAAPGSGTTQLTSPSCPAASQVGTVSAGTGAGPIPFHVNTGRAYLAGPYKGAPLSLAIVMPAVAGPLDLGSVLVRNAIHVDPATAQLSVVSDPIPLILEGIPLSVRSLYVAIDRPDFVVAPTSCEPMSVAADLSGSDGAKADPSTRFQVGGCGSLGFEPRLGLRLLGPTKRGKNPRLRAVLRMPAGGANIDRAAVALPRSVFLDQSHIRTVCTRVQYAADACPAGSIYGYARAFSPLLDEPLQGPVYLRSSNNTLPDLVAALHGQIDIDLAGRIDTVRGGIRNTFAIVPDAPVSKFVLTMKGGKRGLLQNSRNLCKHASRASVRFDAHSGKVADPRPKLRAACTKSVRARPPEPAG